MNHSATEHDGPSRTVEMSKKWCNNREDVADWRYVYGRVGLPEARHGKSRNTDEAIEKLK